MRILTLDAALARCCAAIVSDGAALAIRQQDGPRGQALLPGMVDAVLAEAGVTAAALDAVAVTVGPGSFTGLRAAIALAHGLALSAGRTVVAVTVAEALRAALPAWAGRDAWVAIDSRRGRVFLDIAGAIGAFALDDLPPTSGPVALAGDAAGAVAERLAARGDDAHDLGFALPEPICVARVAAMRIYRELPALTAQPLYIDPPEAKPPSGGLRPPPAATQAG